MSYFLMGGAHFTLSWDEHISHFLMGGAHFILSSGLSAFQLSRGMSTFHSFSWDERISFFLMGRAHFTFLGGAHFNLSWDEHI